MAGRPVIWLPIFSKRFRELLDLNEITREYDETLKQRIVDMAVLAYEMLQDKKKEKYGKPKEK
jgi:hypothetical protein